MDDRGKMNKACSVLALSVGIFALALLAPVAANAQVTVKHIKVTLSPSTGFTGTTASYCDTNGTSCLLPIWNLGASGTTLLGGQTLVLTQTGLLIVGTAGIGGNFDTSDRIKPTAPFEQECNSTTPCTVDIDLDTGSGLVNVYHNAGGNPLNNGNVDSGAQDHQEQAPYLQIKETANYKLSIGYADNVHGCTTSGCFPDPFDGTLGTTRATFFIGGSACTAPVNCYDSGAVLIVGKNVVTNVKGRMTGGGSVFTTAGLRVTHGFELHCDPTDLPNNLEINWDGGNNFHLTSLTTATCIDNPAIAPPPPDAGFDTYIGTGLGTCNGLPAAISFILTDAGEPGTKDTATFHITGACTLDVSNFLDNGNQQAHKN